MAFKPDGHIPKHILEHPELKKRGIILTWVMRPDPCTFFGYIENGYRCAVKIVRPGSQEASIYQRLQRTENSSDHTLRCEIIGFETMEEPFLVFPYLADSSHTELDEWPLSRLLGFIYQVLEGLEYLHNQHIAHLDLALPNTLVATPQHAHRYTPPLPLWKVYIIDFGASRQLDEGPGFHGPVELPETQCTKPLNMTSMDPYSWDMYCAGKLCEQLFRYAYARRPNPQPWLTRKIPQWLIGYERGCVGVCHCRPTARRARQVLAAICWANSAWERLSSLVYGRLARCRTVLP